MLIFFQVQNQSLKNKSENLSKLDNNAIFSQGKFWTYDYAILLHVNLRSENMIFLSNKTKKDFSPKRCLY